MAISVANLSRRLRFENFPSVFQSRRTNLCQSVLIQTLFYAVNKNVLIETIRHPMQTRTDSDGYETYISDYKWLNGFSQ